MTESPADLVRREAELLLAIRQSEGDEFLSLLLADVMEEQGKVEIAQTIRYTLAHWGTPFSYNYVYHRSDSPRGWTVPFKDNVSYLHKTGEIIWGCPF